MRSRVPYVMPAVYVRQTDFLISILPTLNARKAKSVWWRLVSSTTLFFIQFSVRVLCSFACICIYALCDIVHTFRIFSQLPTSFLPWTVCANCVCWIFCSFYILYLHLLRGQKEKRTHHSLCWLYTSWQANFPSIPSALSVPYPQIHHKESDL